MVNGAAERGSAKCFRFGTDENIKKKTGYRVVGLVRPHFFCFHVVSSVKPGRLNTSDVNPQLERTSTEFTPRPLKCARLEGWVSCSRCVQVPLLVSAVLL